ncbi:DUF342 domain-containing protein [Clostridium sp. ZS2-4]|uniref:DUF342 domain-containing protein n=1 Tax=Clostridium sp. ZS2-4 TaxID=2987703 RepID=UPI00227CDFA1|nr:flagellar assembly protein A [Clostridium sp. ZS2-4]MCY6353945.1 FapA family protein [Clostridium sp. ZS2-4]
MSEQIFTGKTLEECLDLASSQLNTAKENIKYKIIEEKKGFFKKKISISVQFEKEVKENKNGSIRVENGKIIVKNPKEGGRPASISSNNEIIVRVDNTEVKYKKEVYEDSDIEVVFHENTAERRMNISISPDKMKAFISIEYIPQNIYTLKDSSVDLELKPEREIIKQVYPKPYTSQEIKEELTTNGINSGIIEENIEKCTNMENIGELLIAQGEETIHGTDDIIKITFKTESETKALKEDDHGKIDYKCIGYVKTVQDGEVLAERYEGKQGKDGVDVKGVLKKYKPGKKITIQAGEGCEFKDPNTIVATIEGKPSVKGQLFCVHQVHEVKSDVDIKTGNIEFVGDIIVSGNVKEGMQISAGHDLFINKNVECAKISSKGDLEILGNIINSTISSGGEDVSNLRKIKDLEKLNSALVELIKTVERVKKHKLLGENIHDGEIIKVLIENKFKYMIEFCKEYIEIVQATENSEEKKLASVIKQKLIGCAPLSIKNFSELNILTKFIDSIIKMLRGTSIAPVNMKISYCQDSFLTSSGNIVISGKGEYVSKIIAYESVEFITPTSVARGGVIKAKNKIKCKKVGSEGGVSTKLIVEPQGNIWADIAYQNTCFIVGKKEYVLDTASKDVHAYLDSEGEIIVDKFVL